MSTILNEVLEHLEFNLLTKDDIKCVRIVDSFQRIYYLPIGHTSEEKETYLNALDIPFPMNVSDAWCGTIWYNDGTWSSSEVNDEYCEISFRHFSLPSIPELCESGTKFQLFPYPVKVFLDELEKFFSENHVKWDDVLLMGVHLSSVITVFNKLPKQYELGIFKRYKTFVAEKSDDLEKFKENLKFEFYDIKGDLFEFHALLNDGRFIKVIGTESEGVKIKIIQPQQRDSYRAFILVKVYDIDLNELPKVSKLLGEFPAPLSIDITI